MPNPYVNKVVQSNGTTLIDISDTTAVAADVSQGKYFYLASGEKVVGTGQGSGTLVSKTITLNGTYDPDDDSADGYSEVTVNVQGGASMTEVANTYGTELVITSAPGSAPSATRHTIYFEFEDETTETEYAYYDDSFISSAITATTPTTRGSKTVTSAQLDGVEWYSYTPTPTPSIPLNTQLIDYSKILTNKTIDQSGDIIDLEWYYASDYTPIQSGMTFSYIAGMWTNIAFYDSSKVFVDSISVQSDGTAVPDDNNLATGTLSGAKIPSNAAYIRMSSVWYDDENLSLIRTA